MRTLSVIMVVAAAILALPFGWGLGVVAAYAIAGRDFGQLPVGTVPLAIAASLVFALSPAISPKTRFIVMAGGTAAFVVIGLVASSI
jgi:hypothetical protein